MKRMGMGLVAMVVAMLAAVGSPVAAGIVHTDAEAALQDARRAHGAHMLSIDGAIARIAEAHAWRMSRSGGIFHNSEVLAELDAAGVAWELVGENVGAGPTVDDVHRAFMASDPHKHNILDRRYTTVGVGTHPGIDGRLYIVEVFVRTKETAAPVIPVELIRAEDGSLVPPSFYDS